LDVALAWALGEVTVEGLIVTSDTWRPVKEEKLMMLLVDESADDDVTLAAASCTDVMPLAASSSRTRAKYVGSG